MRKGAHQLIVRRASACGRSAITVQQYSVCAPSPCRLGGRASGISTVYWMTDSGGTSSEETMLPALLCGVQPVTAAASGRAIAAIR